MMESPFLHFYLYTTNVTRSIWVVYGQCIINMVMDIKETESERF